MNPNLPRVAITYCTQCKWMLRAAYFGQELLSTFGTTIGEIALIPATGGIFTVHLTYRPLSEDGSTDANAEATTTLLWDRKAEGGFPETKILKQRVRNHLDPTKNLGHSDTPANKKATGPAQENTAVEEVPTTEEQAPAESTNEQSVYVEVPSRQGAAMTVIKPDGTICEDCD